MLLLNVNSYEVVFHQDSKLPPYAILSHVWGNDEVTLNQLRNSRDEMLRLSESLSPLGDSQDGRSKIIYTCRLAAQEGLEWAWIDTCCIDKSSSAELSEAINSMFKYYQGARVCYAYLVDVESSQDAQLPGSQFRGSKWFTRGWTLQELLAPSRLLFYGRDWRLIGPVSSLHDAIEKVTGIGKVYLLKDHTPAMFRTASVATRMSWASKRQTTRPEDQAYCLLGLFDINMPLLYGEGPKAFLRLQEEILKQSDDETILAWGYTPGRPKYFREESFGAIVPFKHGFLATEPAAFAACGNLLPWTSGDEAASTISISNRGLTLNIPIQSDGELHYAMLRCSLGGDDRYAVFLPLVKVSGSDSGSDRRPGDIPYFYRSGQYACVDSWCGGIQPIFKTICIPREPWWPQEMVEPNWGQGFWIRRLPAGCHIVHISHPEGWSPLGRVLSLRGDSLEPRILFGRYPEGRFLIKMQVVAGEWKCGISFGLGKTFEELLQSECAIKAAHNSHTAVVTMQKEKVFGKEIMIIDVNHDDFLVKMLQYKYIIAGAWFAMIAVWFGDASDPSDELAWLKEASKIIGNKTMNNSRYTYLLEMVDCSIRDMKLDEVLEESIHRQEGPEQQQHLQYRLHTKYRMEGLQNLERLVARLRSLLVYNLSRFNSQATVIASLISHADARTGITIAEASMETAEAARKDASAMKTLAVMSMLLLPGTFIAALFAIPSLRWDRADIIGPNFWMFWAMAIPLTVVVFIVWFFLNHDTRYTGRGEKRKAKGEN